MRIAIVGAGALGAFYGALLQRGGADVRFLLGRHYEQVKQHGLQVRSCIGDFHLPQVQAVNDPAALGEVDLIFIGLKTTANDQYGRLVGPAAAQNPQAAILTAQNGLGNEERLAELFGAERIYGGLAFLCCNRRDDGTIHHLDYGELHVGCFKRPADGVLTEFARLLQAGGMGETDGAGQVGCQVVDDLALARWKKLEWNVPFNGLSAALDLTCDKIMADADLRARSYRLMQEVQAAAAAHGHLIEDAFLQKMMDHTDKMAPYYTSMHLDRRQGRPMEIESIFGEPFRRGQGLGVPMPELELLYKNLRRLVDTG